MEGGCPPIWGLDEGNSGKETRSAKSLIGGQQHGRESLSREEPARRSIQFEDGRKGKGVEDNEVRDDGSSPLKLMPTVSTAAVIPKKNYLLKRVLALQRRVGWNQFPEMGPKSLLEHHRSSLLVNCW